MWNFAVGIFLVQISDLNFTLVASLGIGTSVATILFSALIGDAIDNSNRLKGAFVLI